MSEIETAIEEVRRRHASDARATIFEVTASSDDHGLVLDGVTTEPSAMEELILRLHERRPDLPVTDRVRRLPDHERAAGAVHALVRAAVAPVYSEPRISAAHRSQYVLGHRVDLLETRDAWRRVRGEDAYIGWMHQGYLETGELGWAQAWERGEEGEPVVSLGAVLEDEAGRVFATLPWGARLVADAPGRLRLPDGRRGTLGAGEIVAVDRLRDRFPPRGESVARTARRWLGTPYLWGGVTPAGADCSGFVQSVYWMHGLALPRDSDQQSRIGAEVEPGNDYAGLRAGDLLFFAEGGEEVTHVAISLGGSHIIHSAVSNASVDVNDLLGEREIEVWLAERRAGCRRVLGD